MKPLEMIAEWRKGCSIAGPASHGIGIAGSEGSPEDCPECTSGLIQALEALLREPSPEMIEAAIAEFRGGLISISDARTASGFATYYRPGEAMKLALSASMGKLP